MPLAHLRPPRIPALPLLAALVAFGAATGCSPDDGDNSADAGNPDSVKRWETVHQGLDGAILSIWGSDTGEVWLSGADRAGKGPTLMRRPAGGDWETLEPGGTGILWWVFSRKADEFWTVGDQGRVTRLDMASGKFVNLPSPTTATIYGIWGAPEGPMWAVGGFVVPKDGEGVLLKIEGDVVTQVTDLPEGIDPKAAFFKVWGSAADDVWVIGEKGTVLHYDGKSWSFKTLPNKPRLVTLHGGSKDDMVVVGGIIQASIYEKLEGGPWIDNSPEGVPSLSGVFVRPDGKAAAAGDGAMVVERRKGAWVELPLPDVDSTWHATWIDKQGGIWVGGGNLGTLQTMNDGTVLRYKP